MVFTDDIIHLFLRKAQFLEIYTITLGLSSVCKMTDIISSKIVLFVIKYIKTTCQR